MRIIGVVDLKDGQAVHARGGRRDGYLAVGEASGVTIAGSATALARLYRDRFDLTEVYVADLNAIAGSPPHRAVLSSMNEVGVSLLVDAGVTSVDAARQVARDAHSIVVGLETLPSDRAYQVWLIADGDPVPNVTFLPNAAGVATVTVPGEIEDYNLLAITVEPLAGSTAPTTDPIITSYLTQAT